jgi:hypothetical protein
MTAFEPVDERHMHKRKYGCILDIRVIGGYCGHFAWYDRRMYEFGDLVEAGPDRVRYCMQVENVL